jgi:hypothetical protein
MRSILEKALIALLNEERDKADALFHEFILERSRQIHESLRQGEDFVLDESWENELAVDEMFTEADLIGGDDVELDDEFLNEVSDALEQTWERVEQSHVLGDQPEESDEELNSAAIEYCLESGAWELNFDGTVGELIRKAEAKFGYEAVSNFISSNVNLIGLAEAADDSDVAVDVDTDAEADVDAADDASFDADVDAEADVDSEDGDIESRVDDIEAELQKLAAEFDALVAGEDDAIDAVRDDTEGGDFGDMDADTESDFGADSDVDTEDDVEENYDNFGESVTTDLEKVSVKMVDGTEQGGGKITQNKKSPGLQPKLDQRALKGEPVQIKATEHSGYDRQTAPKTTDMPKRQNTKAKAADGRATVKKEGDKSATLNDTKADAAGQKSLIGSGKNFGKN